MLDAEKICEAIQRGEDVSQEIAQAEPELKNRCAAKLLGRWGNALSSVDALYDVSESVRSYWDGLYPTLGSLRMKYEGFLRFVDANERYRNIPHTQSAGWLRAHGWTAADVMAAYLHSRITTTTVRRLSPDVAAQAAREDPKTALDLLEGKGYDQRLPFLNATYWSHLQFEWMEFLYYFMQYEDRRFLEMSHKSKRLCRRCEEIRNRLEQSAHFEKAGEELPCPDFSVFQGILLKQSHLMHSAAGQGLKKGNEQNGYYVMSLHLLEEETGCGAALCFDPLQKSPSYADTKAKSHGVVFYSFSYPYLSDAVPDSWRRLPQEMPREFLNRAYRAFSMVAGLSR